MGFLIILGLIGLVLVYGIYLYNDLVKKKTLVGEGWSGIDTQLKRRANLIPNLVETVKGYAAHEKQTLEEVTNLRTKSVGATGVAEQAQIQGELTAALGRLFAVAEAYPDLKANENFMGLQSDLSEVEDQIQLSRRYYNGTVRDMNIAVESFPSNIVSGMFNFVKAEFFEIEDPKAREVPQVSFDS